LDDLARHHWIATHILPLETQARRWLSRHARSLTQSDADDLIQESYSRIWSADFSAIHAPRAYLYTTLRNLLTEHARHAKIIPMERMGEIDELRIPSDEPAPERRIAARQELEQLNALINTLPAQCRRVFELRKVQGYSQREVAAQLEISERTVEKHLAKALNRILRGRAGEDSKDAHEASTRENADTHGIRAQDD
jgi:RNA polymerase sigma factor (sigma-70 family)